ncbi:hypothetical protein H6F32_00995 [Anabaena sp. FACHB-1237]|uniref:hypothetical protein n=1 Tax=Anabaena sp. FACHB-1237 TaxID=2692769 RepID=UPI001680B3EF|nr:hypothetical protein [Anabaena sp. FACHB-1237]MBD2136188.1 hypothetical protein [Anabaena sp. FACHB-1237]
MANKHEVKKYLAHWFQLGKKVVIENGKEIVSPKTILKGDRYSPEFEECWHKIMSSRTSDCYLEDTQETIADLLTPAWEMVECGRCMMPVPIKTLGLPALLCPCYSLYTWPNQELPQPRCPVNSQEQLLKIHNRLVETRKE